MNNTAENQTLDPQQVLEFLKDNSEWLANQDEILEQLSSQSEEGTISLAERQLQNLRKENSQLKNDIGFYLANARNNEQLLNTTFDFCLELLLCADAESLEGYMQAQCQQLFQLPQMQLYLKVDEESWAEELKALRDALGDNMPDEQIVTGRLVSAARNFVFGEVEGVASVALIPIGNGCEHGMLVLASSDEQHFDPQKGDLFLQLIAKSLLSWCQQKGN